MYSLEYAKGTLIGAYSVSISWMQMPVTFFILLMLEPTIVVTCKSSSGALIPRLCRRVSEMNMSLD